MYNLLPIETINSLFEYKGGDLLWKVSRGGTSIGDIAGRMTDNGYRVVKVNGVLYPVHRIVYQMHGGDVSQWVDHIDGNPLNNSIENLRGCTRTQNQHNRALNSNNTSGVKNVYRNSVGTQWNVSVRVNGQRKFIGGFYDLELAELVAMEARNKYHGEYANHGSFRGAI